MRPAPPRRYKRNAEHLVNNVWAVASTLPFFPVEIRGKENLPPPGQPVMFVANHQARRAGGSLRLTCCP